LMNMIEPELIQFERETVPWTVTVLSLLVSKASEAWMTAGSVEGSLEVFVAVSCSPVADGLAALEGADAARVGCEIFTPNSWAASLRRRDNSSFACRDAHCLCCNALSYHSRAASRWPNCQLAIARKKKSILSPLLASFSLSSNAPTAALKSPAR